MQIISSELRLKLVVVCRKFVVVSEVEVVSDSQRRFAAWIGGSMFASLSTFDQVAITKQEQSAMHIRLSLGCTSACICNQTIAQEYEDGKADVRSLVARKTF